VASAPPAPSPGLPLTRPAACLHTLPPAPQESSTSDPYKRVFVTHRPSYELAPDAPRCEILFRIEKVSSKSGLFKVLIEPDYPDGYVGPLTGVYTHLIEVKSKTNDKTRQQQIDQQNAAIQAATGSAVAGSGRPRHVATEDSFVSTASGGALSSTASGGGGSGSGRASVASSVAAAGGSSSSVAAPAPVQQRERPRPDKGGESRGGSSGGGSRPQQQPPPERYASGGSAGDGGYPQHTYKHHQQHQHHHHHQQQQHGRPAAPPVAVSMGRVAHDVAHKAMEELQRGGLAAMVNEAVARAVGAVLEAVDD
jgi:hypothetical protein